jgi:tetratricopeptide (TPR) repeat protein
MGFATLRRSVTAKIAQGQYDAAKAVIAAAAPYLSADDTRDLVVALYDVWGHSKIDAGDWPGAAAVYSEGLSIVPDSRDLGRNAAYVIQEWSAEALRDGGPPAFVEVARKARKSLAALDSLDRVLGSVAGRDVQRMVDAGTPEQAIALVETAAEVLPDKNVIDLKELAYDQWARGLGDKGDWVEALRVYDLGLADVPNSGLLKNNREYAASKTR